MQSLCWSDLNVNVSLVVHAAFHPDLICGVAVLITCTGLNLSTDMKALEEPRGKERT